VAGTKKAYDEVEFDERRHSLAVLPLDLSDLRSTRAFAQQTLDTLGPNKVDLLLLNAAISNGSEKAGPRVSKWSETHIVNHLGTP